MAIIDIPIGKSKYKIECPEEEKSKLLHLANKLNQRVNKLSFSLRNVDEKTLLVICALMIEDEVESGQQPLDDNKNSEKLDDADVYAAVSENMENVADYVENLAKKIANY